MAKLVFGMNQSLDGDVDYTELRTLKRIPEEVSIWAGGARSAELSAAVGPRARRVASLEELRGLLDRHAA